MWFSYSYSFGFDRPKKMHIFFFLWGKSLKINQKLHGGDRKHIIRKKKSPNQQMSFFHPYAIFNCPYLKIDLCDLFLGLLESITNIFVFTVSKKKSGLLKCERVEWLSNEWSMLHSGQFSFCDFVCENSQFTLDKSRHYFVSISFNRSIQA